MDDLKENDIIKIAWDPGDFYTVEWIGKRRGFWVVRDIKTGKQMVCRPSGLCHKEKIVKKLL